MNFRRQIETIKASDCSGLNTDEDEEFAYNLGYYAAFPFIHICSFCLVSS